MPPGKRYEASMTTSVTPITPTPTGHFITLEGGEGSGKSTLIGLLSGAFAKAGLPHLTTREPGGTAGAESIRKLVVEGPADSWDPMTETILFTAARVDHVRKKILPALRQGTHVLCDRFYDSTLVYQGLGKGLGAPFIEMLHHFCLGNLAPGLTLILDVPPEEGLKRASARRGTENRFEDMDISFHRTVREGFLSIAAQHPGRCAVIDAGLPATQVYSQAAELLKTRLGLPL